MMRAPHRYGMGRANDSEAGGVAELQTDVMRFMAILALCLVVIFALVQSIPRPAPAEPTQPAAASRPTEPPEPAPEASLPAVSPVSVPEPEPATLAEVLEPERPAPVFDRPRRDQPNETQPAESPPAPAPSSSAPSTPVPSPTTSEQKGFTLQFESDTALKRLVERNAIGLFAIEGATSLRMNASGGRVSFWPASLPNAFHEMDPATVPADVLRALRLTRGDRLPVTWGVTLPANLQRELDDIVREHDGGALYIAGDGRLRLER